MNTTLAISKRTLVADAGLMALVCLVPTFSHLLSFPLYHLDPMRMMLFAAMLIASKNGIEGIKQNGILFALAMPLVACAVTGMPSIVKAMIIIAELVTNVVLFCSFNKADSKASTFVTLLLSTILAKGLYYGLKAAAIGAGLMSASVVGTDLLLQATVVVSLTVLFTVVYAKLTK